ncbi:hypothetical protein [Polynucleobacter sphagniphilus]|jgi:hypothetical protein|uniref:Uncharacterized protein n=1 Tax=Polynucleobacter sphagniphilus TaxID=1743169 RepID=A0AA43S6V3_9BURK|nr:hypothetical protein [Polynucleobacter sphagniphilus]MDH6504897.1 hypothetical protein [Polynucleobacter sphagniphilus]MDH6513593.1 hypothetical protein [Polynucleobacter sphagniphilus]
MKAEIRDGKLFIEMDLQEPTPSSSGKTLVMATSHGNQTTTAMYEGQPIIIGLNAYIRKLKKSQALALGIPINANMTD